MGEELSWGLPIIWYLFLAGTGAGAVTVSASVFLRGGGFHQSREAIARYGAFIGPLPVIVGTALIVAEIGAPFRILNLFKFISLSPMSIGAWFVGLFIILSILYAGSFLLPVSRWATWLKTGLAWICLPFGIGVAVYTGVLLGAMPSRPFWNSPMIAFLFLLSALSAGTAMILFVVALHRKWSSRNDGRYAFADASEDDIAQSTYILTNADAILLAGEIVAIFLLIMFAHLTIGSPKEAIKVILSGGDLAMPFWILVVLFGLVVPFLVEIALVMPKLLYGGKFHAPPAIEMAVPVVILVGGFYLRYVVVVAGQVTGPVGL